MKKNKKSNKAVASQKSAFISRNFLAAFFGLPPKLIFAVAETADDDGGVHTSPVMAIVGASEYISLTSGEMKTCARARGIKQDLYPAVVSYNAEKDEFMFKSSVGSVATISVETLKKNFSPSVIGHYTI